VVGMRELKPDGASVQPKQLGAESDQTALTARKPGTSVAAVPVWMFAVTATGAGTDRNWGYRVVKRRPTRPEPGARKNSGRAGPRYGARSFFPWAGESFHTTRWRR